jgi:Tfp pilus assembly protein PilF
MITTKPQTDLIRWFQLFPPTTICLFLVVATVAIYWPVTNCNFVTFDDVDYFTNNNYVQTGLSLANIKWAFTTGFAANWHPLTWISLMIDAQLFGNGPFGPHLVNLLLHGANTGLLFFLLRQLTSATWKSAFVAALFALHPLHTESVAWVAERKDVLSVFFGLISLCAYARYVGKQSTSASPRSSKLDYFFALLFFALSLMSKPMLVTLPFLLLLLDYWPLQRFKTWNLKPELKKLIFEKMPFLALSILSSAITLFVQQKGGAVKILTQFSMTDRLGNAFVSYARYLGKTLWPVNLANPYPHPGTWPTSLVLSAIALFILLCVATVMLRHKYPFGFVGWFWFVGLLIPTIGLVQVGTAAMADRYTYLPLIGIFIILAWGIGEIASRWCGSQSTLVLFATLILTLCAWRTRLQVRYWHDTGALFNHAVEVTKGDYFASNALGVWMSGQMLPALALECFSEANRIQPDNVTVLYNMGNCLAKLGQNDLAIDHYRHALQIGPVTADLLSNLGSALVSKKQYAEAGTTFEMALKIKPDSVGAHNNLAAILFKQHRFSESAQHFQEALRYFPDSYESHDMAVKAQIYSNLGDALVQQGKSAEAMQSYQQALLHQPDNAKIKAKLQALGAP